MGAGEVSAEGRTRRRCSLVGRSQKSENEREAMSIMKYILLKWRRGGDFVDRVREGEAMEIIKRVANNRRLHPRTTLECGKFWKFSFRIVSCRCETNSRSTQDVWASPPRPPRFIGQHCEEFASPGVKVMMRPAEGCERIRQSTGNSPQNRFVSIHACHGHGSGD